MASKFNKHIEIYGLHCIFKYWDFSWFDRQIGNKLLYKLKELETNMNSIIHDLSTLRLIYIMRKKEKPVKISYVCKIDNEYDT